MFVSCMLFHAVHRLRNKQIFFKTQDVNGDMYLQLSRIASRTIKLIISEQIELGNVSKVKYLKLLNWLNG